MAFEMVVKNNHNKHITFFTLNGFDWTDCKGVTPTLDKCSRIDFKIIIFRQFRPYRANAGIYLFGSQGPPNLLTQNSSETVVLYASMVSKQNQNNYLDQHSKNSFEYNKKRFEWIWVLAVYLCASR